MWVRFLLAGPNADVDQLVEQQIENPCVTSSNLVFGTKKHGVVSLVAKPRVVIPLSRVRFSYDSPNE